MRDFRFHDIRHTFASLLLSNGESPVYVKEQMGHSSIKMTVDIYGHWIKSGDRKAVNKLDEIAPKTHLSRTLEKTKAVISEDYSQFVYVVPKGRLELPRGNPH